MNILELNSIIEEIESVQSRPWSGMSEDQWFSIFSLIGGAIERKASKKAKIKLKELRTLWRRRHIQSKSWMNTRMLVLEKFNYECQIKMDEFCTNDKLLQVHHLNYDRLGREDVEGDLTLACDSCHRGEHSRIGTFERRSRGGWGAME